MLLHFLSYFCFITVVYLLGALSTPLKRGVDCPEGALYLDSAVYYLGYDETDLVKDIACVFEYRYGEIIS